MSDDAPKASAVILEVTRGHIQAAIDGKTVWIEGELLMPDQPNLPDFVVYKDRILRWDHPNDGDQIDDAARDRIIANVQSAILKERGMRIDVE